MVEKGRGGSGGVEGCLMACLLDEQAQIDRDDDGLWLLSPRWWNGLIIVIRGRKRSSG